jgi:hypothetical protein
MVLVTSFHGPFFGDAGSRRRARFLRQRNLFDKAA